MITAAYALVAIQICVALFQLALVLGAPMGEYTLGGQNIGKLPPKLRILSAVSMILNLGIAGHYLAQAGNLTPVLPGDLNGLANWALVGFNFLGLIMNSISRSKKERRTWVPVLLLSVSCSLVVALGY